MPEPSFQCHFSPSVTIHSFLEIAFGCLLDKGDVLITGNEDLPVLKK
ncbi:MAG: hypothetical protein IPF41_13640 [Flavobacteriales bacterium]|nr:hypothetical protein [Flavobacteriales bacterium]